MKPHLYKGIEYIEIREVPSKHRSAFNEWAASNMKLIKILKQEDDLISNCVQYKDYVYWESHIRVKKNKSGDKEVNRVEE